MKTESISAAKNGLSALIKWIQKGEPVLITDRGVPVAKLVPVQMGEGLPERIVALAHQGLVRLPERHPRGSWLDRPRPVPTSGPGVVEYLLDERRAGR